MPKDPEKEESGEDKLRKKIAELVEENENLREESSKLELFKSLAISEKKEHCSKCQKLTCQTPQGTCCLCELEEQIKQLEAIISKDNLPTCERI